MQFHEKTQIMSGFDYKLRNWVTVTPNSEWLLEIGSRQIGNLLDFPNFLRLQLNLLKTFQNWSQINCWQNQTLEYRLNDSINFLSPKKHQENDLKNKVHSRNHFVSRTLKSSINRVNNPTLSQLIKFPVVI